MQLPLLNMTDGCQEQYIDGIVWEVEGRGSGSKGVAYYRLTSPSRRNLQSGLVCVVYLPPPPPPPPPPQKRVPLPQPPTPK